MLQQDSCKNFKSHTETALSDFIISSVFAIRTLYVLLFLTNCYNIFSLLGHRFRPAYDFDYVALDLLGVYPVDSGVYTCQARNQLGEAVTSCSVRVIGK